MSFLKIFPKVYVLKEELNITWTSFWVQQFLIGQPIEAIRKRPKRYKKQVEQLMEKG